MSAPNSEGPKTRFPKFDDKWSDGQLDDIATTVTSGSRDWAQYYADEGSKFIRMTNLSREGIHLLMDNLRFVSLKEDSSEGKRTSLAENDILISITAELGKIGIIPKNFGTAYINQHTALVRLDLDRADARFVAYKLSSKKMNNRINRLNDAGAKSGLNLPTIRSFPLVLPTLPEQQKIADFLTAVDERIAQLKQKKALLTDYKKGVMQQLFTQAIRFKDDLGNEFPDWEPISMEQLYPKIRNGFVGTATPFYTEEGVQYIQGRNIKSGKIQNNGFVSITEEFHDKCSKSKLRTNDIVMVQSGHVGECAVVHQAHDNSNCHALLVLTPRDKGIDSRFYVSYFYSSLGRKNIYKIRTGNTIAHILSSDLKKEIVPFPSINEQNKISNFLGSIDTKLESVSTQITETQTFKRGLLQQMFV